MLAVVAGKVTGKSQFTSNDFCQFYRDFQGSVGVMVRGRVNGYGRVGLGVG